MVSETTIFSYNYQLLARKPAVKLLFDFFPLILFFIAFNVAGIFVATAVAIAASVGQIGWVLVKRRRVTNLQWASLAIIVVFGGATLILHDETFIKWKPTVLYWVMGLSFLVALAFKTNLAKSLMAEGIQLPEPVWTRVAVMWAVFFLFEGALNLWVAFHYSMATWVTFKTFGSLVLVVAFVVAQTLWLSKYMQDDEPAKVEPPQP
jgi:intracellular septation protein